MADGKAGLGRRVTVSDTGQRANGMGRRSDLQVIGAAEIRGWICRGPKRGSPRMSRRNSENAEVAASAGSRFVCRGVDPGRGQSDWCFRKRDTNCWRQCQRGQDSTGRKKRGSCPSCFASTREKGGERWALPTNSLKVERREVDLHFVQKQEARSLGENVTRKG